ncbi:serine O-acetyltransferase [Aquimarina agarilytica]|uniref:serine O-acetyltransferase n=1 Tax=Aquimarina agarilytica TaxID=1087449 RepID=UPI000289FB20|nr:serine O-acetyltransferase [Aquimarina agarilytica]
MNPLKTAVIKQIESQKKDLNLPIRLKERTEYFTSLLFETLFDTEASVETNIDKLAQTFDELVDLACWKHDKSCGEIWMDYLGTFPNILNKLQLDAKAFLDSDPAANSIEEVYLAYPGFFAIAVYRFSHELYIMGLPLVPRLMTEYAHRLTGTEINAGAQIGDSFFIDHATGTIIGETVIIKNNVKIYQGVTLGAKYVTRDLKGSKRHPTVEDNVIIYANATILGGDTIIGANSIIGGNVWLTKSVPENSVISNTKQVKIKTTSDYDK